MPRIKSISLSLAVLISYAAPVAAEFGAGDIRILYNSKYVSEGRDNLEKGGLGSLEANLELVHGFSANFWHGESTSSSYRETKYTLAYGVSLPSLDITLGATHLEFRNDSDDVELAVALASVNLPVTLAMQYVYSNNAAGAFVEMTATRDWNMSAHSSLAVELLLGFDLGFATAEHDGSNNVQLGVDYSTQVNEQLELVAFVRHSVAGEDIDREQLDDQSWAGLGINYQF